MNKERVKFILLLYIALAVIVTGTPGPAQAAGNTVQDGPEKFTITINGETVKVGKDTPTFTPEVTIYKWGTEASVTLYEPSVNSAPLNQKNSGSILTGDTIQWASKDLEFLYYPLGDAFEYEIRLANSKAGTDALLNNIAIPFATENLDFHFQPPLTEEFSTGYSPEFQTTINVTATQVIDSVTGYVYVNRPENIVNSIAAYHTSRRDNEYMTGKAFHIYRPMLIDNDGDFVYADIHIIQNELVIDFTLVADWLNGAKYPVTIDPTFGYTSVGGTDVGTTTDLIFGTDHDAPEDGTLVSLSYYLPNRGEGDDDGPQIYVIYDEGTNALVDQTAEYSSEPTDQWNHHNFLSGNSTSNGTTYRMGTYAEEYAAVYDTVTDATDYEFVAYPGNLPDPWADGGRSTLSREYSIYVTYTTGASAPTVTTNAAVSVEETTANVSGNITATGGENPSHVYWYYDIDSGPPYANSVNSSGNFSVGYFSFELSGLTEGELYYGHASANNSGGTGNGSEVTFLTKPDPATSFVSTGNGTSWISSSWTNGTGTDYIEIRYDTGSAPADNTSGTLGLWDGTPVTTANVSGLSANTTYYFRIFTHANEGGLWSTADGTVTFQDTTDAILVPTIVTNAAFNVEETTATASGNITDTGGENAQTIAFQFDIDTGEPYADNVTDTGSYAVGNFTLSLTSLTKGELYYGRAGANNSAGWGWGSEVTFLTKPDPATSFNSTDNGTSWISLGWINGTGMDIVEIRYAEGAAPSDNTSGTLGFWGNATSANVTGLSASTTYFFTIFTHVNEGGLWNTADGLVTAQDTTDATAASVPTVVTGNATSIDYESVTGQGNITNTGGANATERGFQYGIGGFTDNVSTAGDFGTGNFTQAITGLVDNTEYQYRAFAINEAGIGYGASVNFTTLDIVAPTVVSTSNTSITTAGATLNGNVTDTGGGNYETRIFEWGLSSGNYTTGNWSSAGSYSTGTFSRAVTGLNSGTTYYWRARAVNADNIGNGAEQSFTTLNVTAVPSSPAAGAGVAAAAYYLEILPDIDTAGIAANNKPTSVSVGINRGFSFPIWNDAGNSDEEVYFSVAVPSLWTGDTDPEVHLNVALDTANTDNNFNLQVEWYHSTAGTDVLQTDTVVVTAQTATGTAAQYQTFDIEFIIDYDVDADDVLVTEDHISFRLRRIDASADEISGEVIVYHIGAHFEIDTPVFEEDMADVATALETIGNYFYGIVLAVPMMVVGYYTLKENNAVFWLVSGAVAMIAGFYWYDNFTNDFGLAIGLMLLVFAIGCFSVAVKYLFVRYRGTDEG